MKSPFKSLHMHPPYEIISRRVFAVSRELMFRAWTKPEHLNKWWGPKGFTSTFSEFDPKPGGKWRYVMHGPDQQSYPNDCTFVQVEAPELLVWNQFSGAGFQVRVSFDNFQDSTLVTLRMIFASEEEYNQVKTYVIATKEEHFDRLEKELFSMVS
jgi:uncharacterized protein YndB with AHSA1/START domain